MGPRVLPSVPCQVALLSLALELREQSQTDADGLLNIGRNNSTLLASLGLSSLPSVRPHNPSALRLRGSKRPAPSSSAGPSKALRSSTSSTSASTSSAKRSRAMPSEPTRRSSRVASRPPLYGALDDDPFDPSPSSPSAGVGRRGQRARTPPSVKYDPVPRGRAVLVPDAEEGAPLRARADRPTRGQDGRLRFEGRWSGVFEPNVTPEEMFRGGAFGGAFFA